MENQLRSKLLKLTVDNYAEKVLDPLESSLFDEIAKGYEALGYEGNDPAYFRGKVAGLRAAVELLKQLQSELYKDKDED